MHILEEELYQAGMAFAACPTAPCHEGHVCATVLERLHGLSHLITRSDEFGNVIAIYKHPDSLREPFRMVAHMDHPGFVIRERELHFAGGVEEKYFAGAAIRFHNETTTRTLGRATVARTRFSGDSKLVETSGSIPAEATFATWDLPKARCTKSLFISPVCDDLAQVALMVALLRRLSHDNCKTEIHALFTRGEEIGFAGAFAALRAKEQLPPLKTLSLEMSRAAGFAKVGGGPIVRVGDRLSVFDTKITHWLETGFRDLSSTRPESSFQRLLMGGGTCEASVFQRTGMPTGAVCVALNNYHNMGSGGQIRSESISLRDWQGLLDFLFFLSTTAKSSAEVDEALSQRFSQLAAKGIAELEARRFSH